LSLVATVLLSGCTDAGSTPIDDDVEVQVPLSPSAEEEISPVPTPSELEACSTVPELLTLAKRLEGGQGPIDISEVTAKLAHLEGWGCSADS